MIAVGQNSLRSRDLHHSPHHHHARVTGPAWITSNWQPGSRNASGTMFSSGITAAPCWLPFHSVVEIRTPHSLPSRYRVEDRERHPVLRGLAHFDVARPGNCSYPATYVILSLGDGHYVSRRRHAPLAHDKKHGR